MESNLVCIQRKRVLTTSPGVRFVITDRIGQPEILPINHNNYNIREKKNSQIMKKDKIYIKRLTKGLNCLMSLWKWDSLI